MTVDGSVMSEKYTRRCVVEPSAVKRFRADGFVLLRGFLSHEETVLLSAVARADPRGRGGSGRETELLGLPKGDPERPKTTLYDALCYSERMVTAMEQLVLPPGVEGGKVTLHHRKIIMKDEASATPEANAPAGRDGRAGVARGGGYGGGNRFYWHQDYS